MLRSRLIELTQGCEFEDAQAGSTIRPGRPGRVRVRVRDELSTKRPPSRMSKTSAKVISQKKRVLTLDRGGEGNLSKTSAVGFP